MAIKSYTDTYKIKGSNVDRFCRIMSDAKKNWNQKSKWASWSKRCWRIQKNDSGHLRIIVLDYLIFIVA